MNRELKLLHTISFRLSDGDFSRLIEITLNRNTSVCRLIRDLIKREIGHV